jgi:quinoprotein glucose dehydrogenase
MELLMKVVIGALTSALVCAVALSAQRPSPPAQTPASSEVAEGRRLFHQKCALCHIANTVGEEPYGPRLSRAQIDRSEDGVRQIIRAGTARMPGFQYTLEAPQIAAIVAFLKTLESPPTRVVISTPAP